MGLSAGAEGYFIDISHMPSHNHGGLTGVSGEHTHSSNATGPSGTGYGLIYQDGTDTMNASVNDGTEPNLFTSSIALTIDPSGAHAHTIASQGGNVIHPTLQPTIYIGNTFIYGGRLFRRARDGTIIYFAK
jgi:hypothetical protein